VDSSAETERGQKCGLTRVKLGSSWGHAGVKLGSSWGQAGVNCTALPRARVTRAGRREAGEDRVEVRVAWRQAAAAHVEFERKSLKAESRKLVSVLSSRRFQLGFHRSNLHRLTRPHGMSPAARAAATERAFLGCSPMTRPKYGMACSPAHS